MSFDTDYQVAIAQAETHFNRARSQAFWSTIWSRLVGKADELLNFQEVKHKLRLNDERYLGLQDVPLDAIVGSVGRYKDFTRTFLPKKSVDRSRWKAIDKMVLTEGYPPVELYKIGDAYFVLDGNHRVSVARVNKLATIEAYVTELRTDVPFERDTQPTDLFMKEAQAFFLRETRLNVLRPQAEIRLTEPAFYPEILHHIEVHRYFLGLDCDCQPTWDEAVASWYDNVYTPMVEAIQRHKMLDQFPQRTPADLYVWLIRHQSELQETYGIKPMSPTETVDDFMLKYVV
jgi:hypothetical protein